MASRRHRGWVITRDVHYPGDYTARRGDEVRRYPYQWGIAGIKVDLDGIIAAEEEAERHAAMLAESRRRRELDRAESERRWLSRLPSTSCRRCGAQHVEAQPDRGPRLPLDVLPSPDGDWVVYACQVSGRVPLVRRAEAGEPIADRYEVHHATCPRRPPMAETTGQLRLRLNKTANLLDRPPRRRARHQARQLPLAVRAEQLEFPTCR